MDASIPHDFHDRGYKFLLSNLKLFQELIQGFVEQPWVSQLDFEKAERVDKSFVLESFLQKESDILYKVPMGRGETLYVYILVEHQSAVDHSMAFRVFLYIAEIWRDFFNNLEENQRNRANFRLPPIFPIVLYNGQPTWTAARRLSELVSGSEIFGSYLPELEYWFIDASHSDLEKLRALRNAVAGVFAMEHQAANLEEIYRRLEEAFSFVYNDRDSVIWRTIWVWFANWLRRNVGEEKAKQLLSHVDPNVIKGEKAMNSPALIESLAKIMEKREEEGILKGILKGRLIGQIQAFEKVLGRSVTPESELQRLETDDLQRLAEALEKEIDARNG